MKKRHFVLRELGKVFVNLGNLTFASFVLGSIIKGDYDRLTILWIGIGLAAVFITVGIAFLTTGGEEWNY